MPWRAEKFAKPRLNSTRPERVKRSQMTDGGSTAGTYQLAATVPVGAELLACECKVLTAFIGDTSATIQVGDGSDVDRYHTGTPSVFTAAADGVAMGVPSGTRKITTANRPTVTITSNADFTNVTAGEVEITITYIEY